MTTSSKKARKVQIQIIVERCKGCGFCIEFCPQRIIEKSTEINSKGYHLVYISDGDKCTGCDLCSMICPDFAINVISSQKSRGSA